MICHNHSTDSTEKLRFFNYTTAKIKSAQPSKTKIWALFGWSGFEDTPTTPCTPSDVVFMIHDMITLLAMIGDICNKLNALRFTYIYVVMLI